MTELEFALFVLAGSAILVGVVRRFALKHGVIDHPTHRGSHDVPTPRGGGLGAVATVLIAFLMVAIRTRDTAIILCVCGCAGVATVGWIDDRRGLPVFTRLFIHLTAGVAVGVLAFQPEVSRPVTVVTFAFWIFWTATSINFVNFMDGINGFVALQIAIFAGSLTLFGWRTASASWYPVAVATACLGFLPWNFPRARIFLGDVGSGALGFLVPVLAIVAMREQGVGFLQAYLPLTPLLGDATVTLIGRWYRGEKLTEAHRHHLYQRSVQLGAGHTRVTLAYAATSLVGAVIAHIEAYRDLHLTLMYIAAVCLLGVLVEWRLRMSQE